MQGSNTLFATASNTRKCQLTIGIDTQKRLHIKLRARIGNRRWNTATPSQRFQIIHHELAIHEITCLFSPCHHLIGGQPLFTLTQRFIHQECLGDRCQLGIHHTDIQVWNFLLYLIKEKACRIERSRKAARKAQIHRRFSLLMSPFERLSKCGHRDLGSLRLRAIAHRFVKIMGRTRTIQIVEMFTFIIEVRELKQIHTIAVYHLVGQITA